LKNFSSFHPKMYIESCDSYYVTVPLLRKRNEEEGDLEEILEQLTRNPQQVAVVEDAPVLEERVLARSEIEVLQEEQPLLLLYKTSSDTYRLFARTDKGTYVPRQIEVEKVPEHILGVGVLGRAFIYENRIQILDSLTGSDYMEVLTHEVLHIRLPHYDEFKIREATRNIYPQATYN